MLGHVCIIDILMRITVFKDHTLVNVSKVASMTHTGGAYNRTHDCRRVTGHLNNYQLFLCIMTKQFLSFISSTDFSLYLPLL